MAFAQLTFRESYAISSGCLRVMEESFTTRAIRGQVLRSTLPMLTRIENCHLRGFSQAAESISRNFTSKEDFGVQLKRTGLCSGFQHDRSVPVALPWARRKSQ